MVFEPTFGESYPLALKLYRLWCGLPWVTMKVRYKLPFQYSHFLVCYLHPVGAQVELSFVRGNEPSHAQGLPQSIGP